MFNGTPLTIEKIPTSSGSRTLDDPLRRKAKVNDFRPARRDALDEQINGWIKMERISRGSNGYARIDVRFPDKNDKLVQTR